MNNRSCYAKYTDVSLQFNTQIASSEKSVALGMTSGIVSIYDGFINNHHDFPTTVQINAAKSLQNLVTSVTSLKFNSTSELLAMASSDKANAIKLVKLRYIYN